MTFGSLLLTSRCLECSNVYISYSFYLFRFVYLFNLLHLGIAGDSVDSCSSRRSGHKVIFS